MQFRQKPETKINSVILKALNRVQSASLSSTVIAKRASRNVAFKVAKLGVSSFARQSYILTPKAAATASSFTHEEDLDDLGCNADLYAFNQDAFEGRISSRKCLQQEQETDPNYFQSLSLD